MSSVIHRKCGKPKKPACVVVVQKSVQPCITLGWLYYSVSQKKYHCEKIRNKTTFVGSTVKTIDETRSWQCCLVSLQWRRQTAAKPARLFATQMKTFFVYRPYMESTSKEMNNDIGLASPPSSCKYRLLLIKYDREIKGFYLCFKCPNPKTSK